MSLLVGICGGSGSGKTTLAKQIVKRLRQSNGPGAADTISFDAYYHNQAYLTSAERVKVNYDHPDSLDADLLVDHLQRLRAGEDVAVPVYDFTTHSRSSKIRILAAADVVVVEGILLFAFDSIAGELDYRVFRRCPEDVRFGRRTRRDLVERGRSLRSIQTQLAATVKPMHNLYVEPYVHRADLVTEHGEELDTVTELVIDRVTGLTAAA